MFVGSTNGRTSGPWVPDARRTDAAARGDSVSHDIMQSALEQVALHCAHEIDTYQTCVDANPNTWQGECADLKAALNACAAKHSGLVNALKQKCQGEIEQYERCLKANAGSPETCMPHLERLWACSEQGLSQSQHTCGPDCKH